MMDNDLYVFQRSPTHAGGLFAMDRKYFFEMGAYDDGLKIWGGENFELSFKVSSLCGVFILLIVCIENSVCVCLSLSPLLSFSLSLSLNHSLCLNGLY